MATYKDNSKITIQASRVRIRGLRIGPINRKYWRDFATRNIIKGGKFGSSIGKRVLIPCGSASTSGAFSTDAY